MLLAYGRLGGQTPCLGFLFLPALFFRPPAPFLLLLLACRRRLGFDTLAFDLLGFAAKLFEHRAHDRRPRLHRLERLERPAVVPGGEPLARVRHCLLRVGDFVGAPLGFDRRGDAALKRPARLIALLELERPIDSGGRGIERPGRQIALGSRHRVRELARARLLGRAAFQRIGHRRPQRDRVGRRPVLGQRLVHEPGGDGERPAVQLLAPLRDPLLQLLLVERRPRAGFQIVGFRILRIEHEGVLARLHDGVVVLGFDRVPCAADVRVQLLGPDPQALGATALHGRRGRRRC